MSTPGGHAIPFHSSVRIKLGAGSQIVNKEKEPIGINVSAKTIKNKVAAPFRTCNFEIHFGKGIKEHEQLFDVLRKNGPETVEKYTIDVGGNGAWKHIVVYNDQGEQFIEKKFHKSDFDQIIKHPEYSQYVDMLVEKVMIRRNSTEIDVDAESYEEVKAIYDDMLDEKAMKEIS